jgi:hypothetical protein
MRSNVAFDTSGALWSDTGELGTAQLKGTRERGNEGTRQGTPRVRIRRIFILCTTDNLLLLLQPHCCLLRGMCYQCKRKFSSGGIMRARHGDVEVLMHEGCPTSRDHVYHSKVAAGVSCSPFGWADSQTIETF